MSTQVFNANLAFDSNLPANGHKITGLANGTASSDSVAFGQLISNNIVGTTTNDNATAGNIGQYVSASDTGGTTSITASGYADFLSISLTAGDWDVSSVACYFLNGATPGGYCATGISTVSGNTGSGLNNGDNLVYMPAPTSIPTGTTGIVPVYRMSLSSTTTVYLKVRGECSSGHYTGVGRISARRVR